MLCKGFPPVVGDKPVVLILGSMPGIKSLEEQEYYAHKQNAFWLIMSDYFNFDIKLSYSKKVQELKQNRIALWDVIGECEREGSLDSSIKEQNMKINNFSELLKNYTSITSIIFNGAMAEKSFRKYVLNANMIDDNIKKRLRLQRLPSTSPANAAIKKQEKIKQWHNALDIALA